MRVEDWLGTDNKIGIDIFNKKYRHKNESFEGWLDRVSGGNETVKRLIREKKFLFGGRILANRGLNTEGQKTTYSNCYVVEPPEDNLESIFECAKKLARTYSYGGGCGADLSKLSPRGSKVRNAAKESSGAVSFMDLYSMVTGLISQNGRRGALMLSMNCDHPDIEEFIDVKKDLDKVTKANISIKATDKFMTAVVTNDWWELRFTREETGEVISKKVKARNLMMKLAQNNWEMGEPGVLFWDRVKEWNLLSEYDDFEYAGANPCSEEPLPAGGSCLLGSMNLSEYVDSNGNFNFDEFAEDVYQVTVAMNKVLDEGLELHPLQEQRDSVRDWRQIGIGIFGLADMLIKMGVTYGSDEAVETCNAIGEYLLNYSLLASCSLAVIYGKTFPMYNYESLSKSTYYKKNVWEKVDKKIKEYGLYNSQLLTIAPTGTLSTMIGVSGGIEPIFANSYERKTESLHGKDVYYKVYTPIVESYMKEHNIEREEDLPEYFVTARTIEPSKRIKMQSVWQNWIDASISSTINLPESATPEDIMEIYIEAWKSGLKGITVFREGCKRAAILSTDSHKEKPTEAPTQSSELPRGHIIEASDHLIGKKRKLITGCGSLHCTAFFDPNTGALMETYLSKGSTGGCANSLTGLSRMISLAARGGVDVHKIVDQLDSCGVCPAYAVRKATKGDTYKGSCCPMAVGNALLDMWKEVNAEDHSKHTFSKEVCEESHTFSVEKCPECGEPLTHEGGCVICKSCGWSKCI